MTRIPFCAAPLKENPAPQCETVNVALSSGVFSRDEPQPAKVVRYRRWKIDSEKLVANIGTISSKLLRSA